jgi:very-short-patch-repair endonuclease
VDDGETVIHWSGSDSGAATRSHLPSVATALTDAMACQPADIAFAIVDSAMHRGLLSDFDRWVLYHRLPERCRASVAQADGVSESGTESLFAYRMSALGVILQPQVDIAGVGRVDFVIGDCLIVEIDSEEHHGTAVQRRRDLHRDAVAAALGFITLRFDYWQIMEDWPTVEAAVVASVARGDHLSARQWMP